MSCISILILLLLTVVTGTAVKYYNAVPKEFSEAAKVDGTGVSRTFWQINFPQMKAVMVSVFLLSFAWL